MYFLGYLFIALSWNITLFSYISTPSINTTTTLSTHIHTQSTHTHHINTRTPLINLGLEDVAEKSVGDLSVWQRRVVLFATEVIAGKDVLFFDRPTSDLDAQSALSLVTSPWQSSRGYYGI